MVKTPNLTVARIQKVGRGFGFVVFNPKHFVRMSPRDDSGPKDVGGAAGGSRGHVHGQQTRLRAETEDFAGSEGRQ